MNATTTKTHILKMFSLRFSRRLGLDVCLLQAQISVTQCITNSGNQS
jgi:hypothetical protein